MLVGCIQALDLQRKIVIFSVFNCNLPSYLSIGTSLQNIKVWISELRCYVQNAEADRHNNDKATILTDTVQMLKDSTAEVN